MEFTKKQLVELWVEVSEKLIMCIVEDQLESIPALLDVRDKLLTQHRLAEESGDVTTELIDRAKRIEQEVADKMNSKVAELRQLLQTNNRQKRINSYEKFETNDTNSILSFYK